MSFVAILVSVISASYYLRIIRELHSERTLTDSNSLSSLRPSPLRDREGAEQALSVSNRTSIAPFQLLRSLQGIGGIVAERVASSIYSDHSRAWPKKEEVEKGIGQIYNSKEDESPTSLVTSVSLPHLSVDTHPIALDSQAIMSETNKKVILDDIEKHLTLKNVNSLSRPYGGHSQEVENILVKIYLSNVEVWYRRATYLNFTNVHAFIIATLTLYILFFALKPSIILNSVVLSTLNIFNL